MSIIDEVINLTKGHLPLRFIERNILMNSPSTLLRRWRVGERLGVIAIANDVVLIDNDDDGRRGLKSKGDMFRVRRRVIIISLIREHTDAPT